MVMSYIYPISRICVLFFALLGLSHASPHPFLVSTSSGLSVSSGLLEPVDACVSNANFANTHVTYELSQISTDEKPRSELGVSLTSLSPSLPPTTASAASPLSFPPGYDYQRTTSVDILEQFGRPRIVTAPAEANIPPYFSESLFTTSFSFDYLLYDSYYASPLMSICVISLSAAGFVLLVGLVWLCCRGSYNRCGRRWATRYYSKCEITTLTIVLLLCLGGFVAFALLLIPAAEKARDGLDGTGDTFGVALSAHLNIVLNMNNLLTASASALSAASSLDGLMAGLPYGTADPVDVANATSAVTDNAAPVQTLGADTAALRAAFSLLSFYPLDGAAFDNNDSVSTGPGIHADTRARMPFIGNETFSAGASLPSLETPLLTAVDGTAVSSADAYVTPALLRTPAAVGTHTFAADGAQTGFYNGSLVDVGRAVHALAQWQRTFSAFEQDMVLPLVAWGLALDDTRAAAASSYADYVANDGSPAAQQQAADALLAAAQTYLSTLPTPAAAADALLEYHAGVGSAARLLLDALPRAKAALDAWASHITYATDAASSNHARDPGAAPVVDGSVAAEVAALDLAFTQDTDISAQVETAGLTAAPYSASLPLLEADLRAVEASWGALPPLLHAMYAQSAFLRLRDEWAGLCPATTFTDAGGNTHHILDRDVGLAMALAHPLFYEAGGVHPGYTSAVDTLSATVVPLVDACRDAALADAALQALPLLAELAPAASPWLCEDTLPAALAKAVPLLSAAINDAAADSANILSSPAAAVAAASAPQAVAASVTALADMVADLHALLQPLLTQVTSPSYQDLHTFTAMGSDSFVAAPAAPLAVPAATGTYLASLASVPDSIAALHASLTPCALPAYSSLLPPAAYALADPDRDDSPLTAAAGYDYANMPYADVVAVDPRDVSGDPAAQLIVRQLQALTDVQAARAAALAPVVANTTLRTADLESLTRARNSVYADYEARAEDHAAARRQLSSWGTHLLVATWILTVAPAALIALALLTRCCSTYFRWVMFAAVLSFLLLLFAGVYLAFLIPYATFLADHCPEDTLVKALQPTLATSVSSDFFDVVDLDLASMAGYFTTCQDAVSTPIGLADSLDARICDKAFCAPTLTTGLLAVQGLQPHGLLDYTSSLSEPTPADVSAGTYAFTTPAAVGAATVSSTLSTLLQTHAVARVEAAHALHTFRCENTIPLYAQLHASLCPDGAPAAYLAVLGLGLAALLLLTTVLLVCAYKRFHTPWRRTLNVVPTTDKEAGETAGLYPETDANPFAVAPHTARPTPSVNAASTTAPPTFALPPPRKNTRSSAAPPPPPVPQQPALSRVPTRSLYVAQVEPHPRAQPLPRHSTFGTSHRTDATPSPSSYPISPKYHTKIDYVGDEPPAYESQASVPHTGDEFKVDSYANASNESRAPSYTYSNNVEMSFAHGGQSRPRADTAIFTNTFDDAVRNAFKDK